MDFINNLKLKAKEHKKTIVLPETIDSRTIEAANIIVQEDFANVVLVGNKDELSKKLENPDKIQIINPHNSDLVEQYVELFVKLRGHSGMSEYKARNLLLNDPLYFGTALVRDNKADGMVAGAINTTADVLRAAIQIVGTAEDTKLVSSFFMMIVPDCEYGLKYGSSGVFLFADCGLLQDPTDEELAQIAISSAKSFKQLMQEEPKIAMLSHSTYGSAKHKKIDKVLSALEIIKKQEPELQVDGELQLDAAIVPSVGKSKAPNSNIAGKANVLIFPDIDAGNIGYKLVQRLAKAEAYGPITQGIAKPVNDLSRGCNSNDIVGAVAITAIQATK